MKKINKLWLGIAILVTLSPLGLIIPEFFKAGSAWGEWGITDLKEMLGYIPKGLEKLSNLWRAPIPDYTFKGWEDKGLHFLSLSYIVSGVIGVSAVLIAVYLLAKFMIRNDKLQEKK
jgi:hypothetical protein